MRDDGLPPYRGGYLLILSEVGHGHGGEEPVLGQATVGGRALHDHQPPGGVGRRERRGRRGQVRGRRRRGEARSLGRAGGLQHLASVVVVVGDTDGGGGGLGEERRRASGGFGGGVDGGPEGSVVEVAVVHGWNGTFSTAVERNFWKELASSYFLGQTGPGRAHDPRCSPEIITMWPV